MKNRDFLGIYHEKYGFHEIFMEELDSMDLLSGNQTCNGNHL